MTRVQASATGQHKTQKTVARAAPSHAISMVMTMPVPGASISIVRQKRICDVTTTFGGQLIPDKQVITDKNPSSSKGIDPHASQLNALDGAVSTKYAASKVDSISSTNSPASSDDGSEVRVIYGLSLIHI